MLRSDGNAMMGRSRRALVAGGVLALLTAVVTPAAPASAAATPSTLLAGQSMQAGGTRPELDSPSGEYRLTMTPSTVELDQYAPLAHNTDTISTATWIEPTGTPVSAGRSLLVMQTDGNLVMYSAQRHVLWASNTARTGAHNTFSVQSDGNLVVRTATGRAVWASRTGATILPAGRTLLPGQSIFTRLDQSMPQVPPSYMVMQADGNVVILYGSRAVWSSRTHVRGSRLVLQTDGNLVVRSPAGKALWATNTHGAGAKSWVLIGPCANASMTNMTFAFLWNNPFVPGLKC